MREEFSADANDFVNREGIESVMAALQHATVLLQSDPEMRTALRFYARFLLSDNTPSSRMYPDLTEFLALYGKKYILPRVRAFIFDSWARTILPKMTVAIEYGPGSGWLIGGLKDMFEECYAFDKRPQLWRRPAGVIFMNTNFESSPRTIAVRKGSLVIANQFLHCLEKPEYALSTALTCYWLVIEPIEGAEPFPYWHEQMRLFGADPISARALENKMMNSGFEMIGEEMLQGQWMSLWKPS